MHDGARGIDRADRIGEDGAVNRSFHAGMAALLVGLLLASAAPAEEARPARFSLVLLGGGAFHEENNIQPAFGSGLGLRVALSRRLGLNLEFDYWTARSRQSFRKLYDGRVFLTPVMISLVYDFEPIGRLTPYVQAGGSYVFTRFRIGSYIAIPEVRIEQRIESGPAFHFGFGASWDLSRSWSFLIETAYFVRTAPAQTIFRDMNTGVTTDHIWANLRTVFLRFGFRLSL